MPVESFWIKFISKVSVNVIDDHGQKEEIQVQLVYGDCKKKYGKNTSFHYCFEGMKRISGPRGRVSGVMVDKMKNRENSFMMH
jgi:hypothetical protein